MSLFSATQTALTSGRIHPHIGALVFATAAGVLSYQSNLDRETNVSIAFSEVGKTIKAYEAEGKTVPPLTLYYAKLSDVAMKVFESRNYAYQVNRSNDIFATELQERVDKSLRIHQQVSETAKDFPALAQNALKSVDVYVKAASKLPPVSAAFDSAWSDYHNDVYRTEYYTETECDSKNVCKTVEKSKEVYDHTTHTYIFHASYGEQAAQGLNTYLQQIPDIKVSERLIFSKKTDIDNEYAIERSHAEKLNGKIPTQAEALEIANTWATASNFSQFGSAITDSHATLKKLAPQWQQALRTARSTEYDTFSHSDSGPKEFQIAEETADTTKGLTAAANKITGGISYAAYAVPQLERSIHEFIGVTLDGKPGDPDKLHREVVELATNLYERNFTDGLNINPFSWIEVGTFTFLGGLAGGGAGYGIGKYQHRRRQHAHTPNHELR